MNPAFFTGPKSSNLHIGQNGRNIFRGLIRPIFSDELDMAFRILNEQLPIHSTALLSSHTKTVHSGLATVIFTKFQFPMSFVVPAMNTIFGST